MSAVPPERARVAAAQPHQARAWAESFGSDPERYDRARPGYPDAMVAAIIGAGPGPVVDVLDIGCGTGIASRQFRAAGCRVLGVEVDPRMAEFAARDGLAVEVAAFEAWDPAGRTFDVVIAGQTWHWVDRWRARREQPRCFAREVSSRCSGTCSGPSPRWRQPCRPPTAGS